MSATALPHRLRSAKRLVGLEGAWVALAVLNYGAALIWQSWEVLPYQVVWTSLAVAYGLLMLRADRLLKGIFVLAAATCLAMLIDVLDVVRLWPNPVDAPPAMAAMCLILLWNARRREDALRQAESLTEQQRSLLERQQQFLQDASHELRTPLTIARGHLDLLGRRIGADADLTVSLQELSRLDGIIERLLLLAAAAQPDFLCYSEVQLVPFLEEVFFRWVDIAPRVWRLGAVPAGSIRIDPDRVCVALDALLENAVKYTGQSDTIELRARRGHDDELIIEIADSGPGVPAQALERIFERFGRADSALGRSGSGVGLGLAIVDAIAKAHAGRCSVRSDSAGPVFALELPRFSPVPRSVPSLAGLPLAPLPGIAGGP